ncbi:hypothetical protein Taro_052780 [Colocasia esculenta]|uniref:Uncharacterized protein n=1 Tax=Colocasia esculenta TaxID=4460 RepID=A0A843XJJ7_COLES|nr:hypothetical protein [Colocasia esculenta]
MVDGDDKNDMGYLYEATDRAKEYLREKNPKAYRKWWAIVDKGWEMTLHHDLHVVGYEDYSVPLYQQEGSLGEAQEQHGGYEGQQRTIRRKFKPTNNNTLRHIDQIP